LQMTNGKLNPNANAS